MADTPRRPRTLNDARTEAEAAFKKATVKVAEAPPKQVAVPGVREQVTLRIDQDVQAKDCRKQKECDTPGRQKIEE